MRTPIGNPTSLPAGPDGQSVGRGAGSEGEMFHDVMIDDISNSRFFLEKWPQDLKDLQDTIICLGCFKCDVFWRSKFLFC